MFFGPAVSRKNGRIGKMTSIANPGFKYYKKLEGTWNDEKGLCEAVLNSGAGIEISYASGKLASSYSVIEAMQLMLNQGGGMMTAMTYTIHDGEELKITLNNRIVYEGDKTLYRVSDAWYGSEELHLEMMDLYDGHKEDLVLKRVKDEEVPLAEGEYQCSCGYRGQARRFCPNCGREIS